MKTLLIKLLLTGLALAQSDSLIPWPVRPQTPKAKTEASEPDSKRTKPLKPAPVPAPDEDTPPDRIEPGWSSRRYDRVILALERAKAVRKSRVDAAEVRYKAELKKFTELGDWQKLSKAEMAQRREFFVQEAKRLEAEILDLKKNAQDLEAQPGTSATGQEAKSRLLAVVKVKEENLAAMQRGVTEAEAAMESAERGVAKTNHLTTLLQAYLERVSVERLLWDTIYDGQIQLAREYQSEDPGIKPPGEMLKERTK